MNLDLKIEQRIAEAAPYLELIPNVVIIHHLHTQSVVYMSSMGLRILNTTVQELRDLGKDYFPRYFNEEEANDYVPKILGLLERNNTEEQVSFFQQVRPSEEHEWTWYLSCTKIFQRDEEGRPLLTITTSTPVESEHYFTIKVDRLLQENAFLRQNTERFALLTIRERQILAEMARGRNSSEIALMLHISEDTIKTHRRNIKRKLQADNQYDLVRFAQAFDLL